ncbi:MAG: hypothetical protein ACE5H7_13560 [Acidiferrobacterales bacterium]
MAAKKKAKRAKKGKKATKRKPVARKKVAKMKVAKKAKKKVAKKVRKKVKAKKKLAKKVKKKVRAKKKVTKKIAKKKVARRVAAPAKQRVVTATPVRAPVTPVAAPAAPQVSPNEERVGVVTHYFTHLGVAVVKLETGILREGDTVHIKGHTSDFIQRVGSMEVEHIHVSETRAGQSFGLKVREHAREHDVVYRVRIP